MNETKKNTTFHIPGLKTTTKVKKKYSALEKKAFVIGHIGTISFQDMAKELDCTEDWLYRIMGEIREERGGNLINPDLIGTVAEEQYNQLTQVKAIALRNLMISQQELQDAQKANNEFEPKDDTESPPFSDDVITMLKHRVNSDLGIFLGVDGALTKFLNAIGHYRPEMRIDTKQPTIIKVEMTDMGEAIPGENTNPGS